MLFALALSVGALAGRVVDADGLPVAGATVIPFERERGLPLHAEERVPFLDVMLEQGSGDESMQLVHAITDRDGRFRIDELPAGTYRVIAQSWADAEAPVTEPLQSNGRDVWLRGVVDETLVPSAAAEDLFLAPLGDAALVVDQKCGNDGTLLLVGRAPTAADPILGFTGWTASFRRGLVAGNRLPDCETTLRGLPAGTLHLAFFANDNSPGFAAAQIELAAGQRLELSVPFVAAWSDGRREPPAELADLVAELAAYAEPPAELVAWQTEVQTALQGPRQRGPYEIWGAMVPFLERRVPWVDGRTLRGGDLLAALAYLSLRQQAGRRER